MTFRPTTRLSGWKKGFASFDIFSALGTCEHRNGSGPVVPNMALAGWPRAVARRGSHRSVRSARIVSSIVLSFESTGLRKQHGARDLKSVKSSDNDSCAVPDSVKEQEAVMFYCLWTISNIFMLEPTRVLYWPSMQLLHHTAPQQLTIPVEVTDARKRVGVPGLARPVAAWRRSRTKARQRMSIVVGRRLAVLPVLWGLFLRHESRSAEAFLFRYSDGSTVCTMRSTLIWPPRNWQTRSAWLSGRSTRSL